jgi:transcriptional regulator with PAS, ATPase and Fis domain
MVERVIATDTRVLITGETGTGKELVARAIHYNGARADQVFLSVNCAAFSPDLLAGELFGHRKGGYTGAVENRPGLFKAADGGTLFLDEIGDCSLELQAHILRALDRGEIRHVGEDTPFHVDVRIVAATNKDLEKEVEAGRFRSDLFFRLSVFAIALPPLRERTEDIALLAEHFLRSLAAKHRKPVRGFTAETLGLLGAYGFPGNVRELQNEVERAFTLADPDSYVTPDLLSAKLNSDDLGSAGNSKGTFYESVARYETQLIRDALARCDGSRVKAAKDLGIARETLFAKLKKYGIERS